MLFRSPKDYPGYRQRLIENFHRSRERPNTKKQDEFVEEVKKTGDPIGSALKVYDIDSPSAAAATVKRNMRKPAIRDELADHYEEAGCEPLTALQVIGKGMRADKQGYTDKDGEFVSGGPDHRIRLDSAKELLKLRDAYPKDTAQHEHRHLHAIMVKEYTKLPFEELNRMIEERVNSAESEDQEDQ